MQVRRQTDRAHAFWEASLASLSGNIALNQLISILRTDDWSYGFLSAVPAEFGPPRLVHCGPDCARVLGLSDPSHRELPPRFTDVFHQGCIEAFQTGNAVRREGEFRIQVRYKEQFRSIFIPVELREATPLVIAFGTINSRIVEVD